MRELQIEDIEFAKDNFGESDNWYDVLGVDELDIPTHYELRVRFSCIGKPDYTSILMEGINFIADAFRKGDK